MRKRPRPKPAQVRVTPGGPTAKTYAAKDVTFTINGVPFGEVASISYERVPMTDEMNQTACPLCGSLITKGRMPSHQAGLRCKVDGAINLRRAQGLVVLTATVEREIQSIEAVVQAAGVAWVRDLAVYEPAGKDRAASAARNGCWVAPADHEFLGALLAWPSAALPLALAVRIARLGAGPDGEEFRRAFRVVDAVLRDALKTATLEELFPKTRGAKRAVEARVLESLRDLADTWSRGAGR